MIANSSVDAAACQIAAAIGEPARAKMLFSLMDGHARTSTELAVIAGVSPSTASVHLNRLKAGRLVKLHAQGKHRYYALEGPKVARVLESLGVLAGSRFVPNTPVPLRQARTCYDHIAGAVGVLLHDRLQALKWLHNYNLTSTGVKGLESLGIDVEATQKLRRRFAYPCLDWSERRPHIGGALGAAIFTFALKRKWILQELDSRALEVTALGKRELRVRFDLLAREESR